MNVERGGIGRLVLVAAAVVVIIILGVAYFITSQGGKASSSTSQAVSLAFSSPLTLNSGGSSFVNPIMQSWIFAFQNLTRGQISNNYQPFGSGAGIAGVISNLFDFGGSDAPVPSAILRANASGRVLLQIPEALGAVAIFYNIPGVSQSLNLSGTVLEKIYLEDITTWNDSQITRLNPAVPLPNHPIAVVHRSDGSGTTYALTTFFSKLDPSWGSRVGVGTSVNWPNSPNPEFGARGSGGVAAFVNQTEFSIGYADSFYATANGLKTAAIGNSAGFFVRPTIDAAAAAAAAFANEVQANATFSITNAPGAASYPISTFTYLLVWKDQSDANKADAVTTFFWWVVHDGKRYSPRLFYAPLPPSVVTIDEGLIRQINYNGHSYAP